MNIKTRKELHGWYYGRELARADLSDLEIERVLKERMVGGKKIIYAKFKNHDASFNRWIEKS